MGGASTRSTRAAPSPAEAEKRRRGDPQSPRDGEFSVRGQFCIRPADRADGPPLRRHAKDILGRRPVANALAPACALEHVISHNQGSILLINHLLRW